MPACPLPAAPAAGVHYNAPFSGALAGLLSGGTTYRKCSSMNGLFQDKLRQTEL